MPGSTLPFDLRTGRVVGGSGPQPAPLLASEVPGWGCRVCAGFIWRKRIPGRQGKEKNKLLLSVTVGHQPGARHPVRETAQLRLGRGSRPDQPRSGLDIECLLRRSPGDPTAESDQSGAIVHELPQHKVERPKLGELPAEGCEFLVFESDRHRRSAAAQHAGVDPVHHGRRGRRTEAVQTQLMHRPAALARTAHRAAQGDPLGPLGATAARVPSAARRSDFVIMAEVKYDLQ